MSESNEKEEDSPASTKRDEPPKQGQTDAYGWNIKSVPCSVKPENIAQQYSKSASSPAVIGPPPKLDIHHLAVRSTDQ